MSLNHLADLFLSLQLEFYGYILQEYDDFPEIVVFFVCILFLLFQYLQVHFSINQIDEHMTHVDVVLMDLVKYIYYHHMFLVNYLQFVYMSLVY